MNRRVSVAVVLVLLAGLAFVATRQKQRVAETDSPGAAQSGASALTNSTNPTSAANPTNVIFAGNPTMPREPRFIHHTNLVAVQSALRLYREAIKTGEVPPETPALFREWAMVLYRDSLMVGMNKLPSGDPVAQEFADALANDTEPRVEMVVKAELGMIPEGRTTNVLQKVAALTGIPSTPDTSWMLSEFEHLVKKAKQRSDSHYMSEMKKQLPDPAVSIEVKVDSVQPFVAIGDVVLAEYPQEYFQQVLQEPALTPSSRQRINDLLAAISEVRNP